MYSVFGERNNNIIHIDDIIPSENGLKCNCVCPNCREKLIAKTLGKKNKKCFSHIGNSNCVGSLETVMHKFAKEVIEKEKKIKIPKLIYKRYVQIDEDVEDYTFENHQIVAEQLIECDKVVLEQYLSEFDFKPDIVIYKNNIPLIVEVAVTHSIDKEKKKKIIKSGISTIEIYLNKNEIFKLSKDELANKIINDVNNKKWIFNRLEKNKKKQIDDELSKTSKIKSKREKSVKENDILDELRYKYKININNLPTILKSSKRDIYTFRYYSIKFYWRLIVWDKFINQSTEEILTIADVMHWFMNTYKSPVTLKTINKHMKYHMRILDAIVRFFKELIDDNIITIIDYDSFSPNSQRHRINSDKLDIFNK